MFISRGLVITNQTLIQYDVITAQSICKNKETIIVKQLLIRNKVNKKEM